MNLKIRFLFFLTWVVLAQAYTQPGTTTEAEVNIQAEFIEGNREKLLGNYGNAVEKYKAVLKKAPKNPAVLYELARVYDVLDQDESALKAIQSAVEGNQNNMWYRMFLGDVYQKMDKNAAAAKVFEELIEDYPLEEYHYFKHAFFLVKAKKIPDAIKAYERLEKKFGITEEYIRRKHTLYVGLGDEKKAAKELEKLNKAFPENTDYMHLLAEYYMQIGDQAAATSIYSQILQLDSQDAKAQMALAGGSTKNDDVSYLKSLKAVFYNDSEDIDTKIKALIPYISKVSEQNNPALTMATLDLADILCEVHPAQAKAFSIKGDLHYHAGDSQAALSAYEKTLELDESVFAVWEQMLYIYMETNDMDGLLATAEKAIDLFPNQAKAYYFYGLANLQKANHTDAVDAFEQAALMSRKNPPFKLDALTKAALAYTHLKKYDAAKKQLDKATEIRADHYLVQDAMGFWHLAQGNHQEAANWLKKALSAGDQNPMVLEHYGDVQEALGKHQNALKYWNMAIEKGGNETLLRKKIGS